MKKSLFLILTVLTLLFLSACLRRSNQPPVIEGVRSAVTIEVGDEFDPLDGVTAYDPEDGNLTEEIRVSGWDPDDVNYAGVYQIILTVTDSAGATDTKTIDLTVTNPDTVATPPVFSGVNSSQVYYIGTGDWDPKEGVTVYDEQDGDLTAEIEVTSDYFLDATGRYDVTLRVTNSLGIRAAVTIILIVHPNPIPTTIPTSKITIRLEHAMGQANTDLLRGYAASFTAKYAAMGYDFEVDIPEGTGSYDTLKNNIINAITARQLPNMVQGYPDHVAEYLNGNAVLNLDPYIKNTQWGLFGDDALEDIIESYRLENTQYDTRGTYYSLPFNKSTEVMIYNKTALDELELDVPETWQDILAMAPLLKEYGDAKAEARVRAANPGLTEAQLAPLIAAEKHLIVPASYDSNGNAFITFTRQWGGAYTGYNYETNSGLYLWNDNANTTAAMNFLKTNRGSITIPAYWSQDYASTPFLNQQTFVTVGSSAGIRYNIPTGQGGLEIFEIGVAPVPYNALRPDDKAVIQQGTNISLMNTGTDVEKFVSWLFLKHLINTENTAHWAMNTGYLPVRTSAYESTEYQAFLDNPTADQLPISLAARAAYLQSGWMFYDPAFIGSSRARTEVGSALVRIMMGDGNIEAALDEAYRQANIYG